MLRFRVTGDHSQYHCGSAAAFDVVLSEVRRHGDVVQDGDFDYLVVNGEGSMHHGNGACRRKMDEISSALEAGKRVALVNTVWQDNPQRFADVLKRCDSVVAREVLSQRQLAAQGVPAAVHLDQSYFRAIDPDPVVDFKGAPVITDFFSDEYGGFVRLNSRWGKQFPFVDMQAMTWSSLVRSLKTASLLITGRHHAVYAACKARCPFLAMSGNTHKIEGLARTAGVSIPVFDKFAELKRHFSWPEQHRAEYERLFAWMEQQSPWTLFGSSSEAPHQAAGASGIAGRWARWWRAGR